MTSYGNQLFTKISGYLEKKGRLRIGSLWKKYWFVLEGRLLLYYRSKNEYEAISPCKGSINLCPPCTIKPASASSCVFQIEGRATTVSLRAESRYEQERWMQALLTATDQSKSNSPNRLSHFRYSLDEIPMPYQDNEIFTNGLQRQNSVSYNTSTPRLDLIGRLQLIGAHTYGGSLDAFTKHTTTLRHSESFKKPQSNTGSNLSISLRNASPEVILKNNSLDAIMNKRNSKSLSLEYIRSIRDKSQSKLTNVIVENDQYCRSKSLEANFIRNKKLKKSESLYERVSNSNKLSPHEITRLRRKSSNVYERISNSSINLEKQIKKSPEPEYSTPMNREDHNKNSLFIENEQYLQGFVDNENEYYKVDPIKELEELYEDPDALALHKKPDFEPLLPPRPDLKKLNPSEENSKHSSIDETKNKKRKRLQILTQLIKSDKKNVPKKKRSTSFIHRILGKKEKPVSIADDVVYEVINNTVEKPKDVNDIQMLEELQKILETRKNILQKKLNDPKSIGDKQLTGKINVDNGITKETVEVVIEDRPLLPPRQNSQSAIIHNTQPTNLTNTPDPAASLLNNFNNDIASPIDIKTIHEIIDDLDKEKRKQDSALNKVKNLIDKFNDLHNEEEIQLRKKSKTHLQRSETFTGVPSYNNDKKKDSEELTKLLEELSKVTNAPVLTPGVTSSLTTPIISDDEWAQVIPIRYRRLSDPDYDIPRPHSSLQLQYRTKSPANVIQATRFFGPVLPSSANKISEAQSLMSMELDSLEIEESYTKQAQFELKNNEKNASVSSYKSHNYSKLNDVIYLQPKSIVFNIGSNNNYLIPNVTSPGEIFIDSLEPLTQLTHF